MSTNIKIEQAVLSHNDKLANQNARLLKDSRTFLLNILASPGAGKTTTILALLKELGSQIKIAVIEGDIAGDIDAQAIKAQGIPVVQINTGGSCHLEAKAIGQALAQFDLETIDLVIVENVGNLVCTADFDLGQQGNVTILSVPEGHDKPVKYPAIFAVSDAVILNKTDVSSAFNFNEKEFRSAVKQLNPSAPIFPISAVKGTGVKLLSEWILQKVCHCEER